MPGQITLHSCLLVLASLDVRAPHASASANLEPRKGEAVDVPPSASNISNPTPRGANEVLLEKGSEAHILSGAVIEPSALDALPGWCTAYSDHPLAQLMDNRGNYIGVEVYLGFAGARSSLSPQPDAEDAQGSAVTDDAGLTCQHTKGRFESGVPLAWEFEQAGGGDVRLEEGKAGADAWDRGERGVARRGGEARPCTPQLGWPLFAHTYCGGGDYHMADGHVSVGLVVGLAYKNPYIGPYREFQLTRPAPTTTRLAYGAHALTEGGLQSLPRLDSPGQRWLAAAVNTPKIKGTHNAMQMGMLATEAAFAALHSAPFASTTSPGIFKAEGSEAHLDRREIPTNRCGKEVNDQTPADASLCLAPSTTAFPRSPAHADLWAAGNTNPSTTTSSDALATLPASSLSPIQYPAFESLLSADVISSVASTRTNHAEGDTPSSNPVRPAGGRNSTIQLKTRDNQPKTKKVRNSTDARVREPAFFAVADKLEKSSELAAVDAH
ncbi:hypothetical protein K438DRAFT_1983983 [Mycena galopus ATCC 62051]|nr:hypothetical protein K438DRAFT_1983983 [Mycena galopus ATCC 62051]